MLDMRHIKITNHSLWCQATNSQASNNHSMLGSSVKPTSRQCYLSIVSQFKAMACMEPYFHVNHEILTLGFQKPKPVTILSKRSHQIFFFFFKFESQFNNTLLGPGCLHGSLKTAPKFNACKILPTFPRTPHCLCPVFPPGKSLHSFYDLLPGLSPTDSIKKILGGVGWNKVQTM